MINFVACPFGFALNAKMVVRPKHQVTGSCTGFVYALCQCNGSRDAGAGHFGHGNVPVFFNVSFNDCSGLRKKGVTASGSKNEKEEA
jgi:hypothetical protein